MSETGQERLNENQFDDEGLPGIAPDFPPDHSWGVEDPALVNGGSETQDNLVTRLSRENLEHTIDGAAGTDGEGMAIVEIDTPMAGISDQGDPDANLSPEQSAMHIVELD